MTMQPSTSAKLRKPSPLVNPTARRHIRSFHWLFRSNIPRRRRSLLPVEAHTRNFFGMGEIVGILANVSPAISTVRFREHSYFPPLIFSLQRLFALSQNRVAFSKKRVEK